MKAKDIAQQLGSLAQSAASNGYTYNDIDMDIPEELQEPDPIFVVEHDDIIKQNYNKALKSVKYIVNSVVPEVYQQKSIITDKIEQDKEQLGQLYYQQTMNNVMIKCIMDTIAKGDTTAKQFDSYTKLMSMAKDINKQITELQNQFRKFYIDTYLDLQHKEEEDVIQEANAPATLRNQPSNRLSNQPSNRLEHENIPSSDELDRRETSTKDTVLKIQDWKREQYKKMYEENKKDLT